MTKMKRDPGSDPVSSAGPFNRARIVAAAVVLLIAFAVIAARAFLG